MDKAEEKLKRKTNLVGIICSSDWTEPIMKLSALQSRDKLALDGRSSHLSGIVTSNFFLEKIIRRGFLFK